MEKYYIERMVMRAISYRIPKKVTHQYLYWNGNLYATCPRCSGSLEREYMSYCNCCGQNLSWRELDTAEIVEVPIRSPKNEKTDAEDCAKPRRVKVAKRK